MDDTRAGSPETNVVLCASRRKEVIDLLVNVDSAGKILGATNLSLNQVITVDGGGVGDLVHTGRHELKDGHLSSSVLTGDTVRSELEVRVSSLNLLAMGIIQMGVENLLGIGQGTVETGANNLKVLGHLLVVDEVALLPVVLANLLNALSV